MFNIIIGGNIFSSNALIISAVESSVRDKVQTAYNFKFDSTADIIKAFDEKILPPIIMLNIHPQRWTDNKILWCKELILQNVKNSIKKLFVKKV